MSSKVKTIVLTEKIVVALVIATSKKTLMQLGLVNDKTVLKLLSVKAEKAEDTVGTRKILFAKACKKFLKGFEPTGKVRWVEYVIDDVKFYACYIDFNDVVDHIPTNTAFSYIETDAIIRNNKVKVEHLGSLKTSKAYREALRLLFLKENDKKTTRKATKEVISTKGASKLVAKKKSN